MLTDISNQTSSAPSSSGAAPVLKRQWSDEDDHLLPGKLKHKRRVGPSSSSSPARPSSSSSPFAFTNTRFNAYDAPTSPDLFSSKLPTSPSHINHASSLPPSSPSFSALNRVGQTTTLEPDAPSSGGEPLVLRLERGTVLQFGRKAKKTAIPCAETTLPILLPKSAKNASRIHCTVKIIPSNRNDERVVVEVRVMGMNGMKIDGTLWKTGSVAVLPVLAGATIDLFFWGWSSTVIVAESEVQEVEEEVPATPLKQLGRRTTPPSSMFNSLFDEDDGDLSFPSDEEVVEPLPSSTQPPPSPAYSDDSVLSALASSPPPLVARLHASPDRAQSLARKLNLDLTGLVASSIVFSPRSTVGVDEVIRGMLKEAGGMWSVLEDGKGSEDQTEEREDQAVEAWWDVVEQVLNGMPFFGCIDNAGLKDASGNPVPPVYFYIPDQDTSRSRVEALEPFVKRVRGARTAKPVRYFWAKPSLRKNR